MRSHGHWCVDLVGDAQLVEVHLARVVALVVVSSLEVALGAVELVRVEVLGALVVDVDGQLVVLVAYLVGEARVGANLANGSALLRAVVSRAQLDAQVELALGVEVELSDGLVGDAVIDVDLTDADLAFVLGDLNLGEQAVGARVRVPRAVLAQLAAAVLAVGGRDAVIDGGDLHGHGAVRLAGSEPLVLVALATSQLGSRDLTRRAIADRLLQGELGQIKVAARSAVGVEGRANGGRGEDDS